MTSPPTRPGETPNLPWYERLNVLNVTLILFLLACVFSAPAARGPDRPMDYLGNAVDLLTRFFPPDFSVLPEIWSGFIETIQISVMATLFSIILSIPLSVGASRNLSPRWLVIIVRMILNAIRTIPSLIWAIIAVSIFGVSPLAGIVALTFYSIGYLGKFFSDAFESADLEVARGLKAMGADLLQAFQHGVWPHAKPLIWSHSLWMLEYNIRSASIIGYVGAGGIGALLYEYQEYRWFDSFCTVLLFLLLVVTILDFTGEAIRRKMVGHDENDSLADG